MIKKQDPRSIYINVIDGKFKGARGYIKRTKNGTSHPNECVIYWKGQSIRACLKDSEIEEIKPTL